MAKTQIQIENCLDSELSNLISEFELGRLNKEIILNYFSTFLLDAEVKPEIIINVLERKEYGDLGKEEARGIKVNLGF